MLYLKKTIPISDIYMKLIRGAKYIFFKITKKKLDTFKIETCLDSMLYQLEKMLTACELPLELHP